MNNLTPQSIIGILRKLNYYHQSETAPVDDSRGDECREGQKMGFYF